MHTYLRARLLAKLIVAGVAMAGFSNSATIYARIVPVYEIYMATQSGEKYARSKTNQFSCDDTIYLFIESSDKTLAEQTLDAIWVNLQSGERHATSNPFATQTSGKRYWSWSGITFRVGGSNPLGILTVFLDPAAGREKFIGEWKVTATINGRYKKTISMNVLC